MVILVFFVNAINPKISSSKVRFTAKEFLQTRPGPEPKLQKMMTSVVV